MSKKAILYTRVSTDEQADKGYSLGYQLERLQKYCDVQGIEFIMHFQDDYSGKTFDRPAFKELMLFCKSNPGMIDYVLFLNWSRFARNTGDSYAMIRQFQKMGIDPQAIEQPLDLSIPENKMMLAFYLATPEVENDRRSLNTAAGMHKAKKEGRYAGCAPVGYKNVREENGRAIIIPHPTESKLVQEAFFEFSKGQLNVYDLRRLMKTRGLNISRTMFPQVLRNAVYIGKVWVPDFKDEPGHYVKGIHEPIVEEEVFQRVQDILSGKSRLLETHNVLNQEFPLRGFLQCRVCGGPMTASASRGNGGRYFYYHCQKGCQERFKAKEANDHFERFLRILKPKEEVLDLYGKVLKDTFKDLNSINARELKRIDDSIAKNLQRIANAQHLMLDGEIDSKDYKAMKATLEEKNSELLREKSGLRSGGDHIKHLQSGLDFLGNMEKAYSAANLEIKRRLIGSIFPGKLIFDNSEYRTTRVNEFVSLICLNNRELVSKKNGSFENNFKKSVLVPKAGLEPAHLATHAPETCVSTNSTTSAKQLKVPRTGFEPAHRLRLYHLKVACLPISPPGHYVKDFRYSFPIPDFKYFSLFLASERVG